MTNSQATANVYFSNSTSQVYTLDATDGTEGALLELVSGSEVGTAAQGLSIVGISVSCENQVEYVSLLDNLGVIIWSVGGCRPEAAQQSAMTALPPRRIGLNWSLKVLTAAS
jgi:hypothetical protein